MLTYVCEAMLSIEWRQYSNWKEHYEQEINEEGRREEPNMLIEVRDLTWLYNECYKGKIAKLTNKKVKGKNL